MDGGMRYLQEMAARDGSHDGGVRRAALKASTCMAAPTVHSKCPSAVLRLFVTHNTAHELVQTAT